MSANAPGAPNARVLVVCAERSVCDVLAALLQRGGYDTEQVMGCTAALAQLDHQEFAIVELGKTPYHFEAFLLACRSRHPRMRILGLGALDDELLTNIRPDATFPLPLDPERILRWLES